MFALIFNICESYTVWHMHDLHVVFIELKPGTYIRAKEIKVLNRAESLRNMGMYRKNTLFFHSRNKLKTIKWNIFLIHLTELNEKLLALIKFIIHKNQIIRT